MVVVGVEVDGAGQLDGPDKTLVLAQKLYVIYSPRMIFPNLQEKSVEKTSRHVFAFLFQSRMILQTPRIFWAWIFAREHSAT